jgi:hypothetical protein
MGDSTEETKHYLTHFLEEFKELICEGKIWIKDRRDTLNTLSDLGYTLKNLEQILLSLTVEDYYAGPKIDIYKEGDSYWEFGKAINAKEYYIKVKIDQGPRDERAVCFSFHRAELPLIFPFKE